MKRTLILSLCLFGASIALNNAKAQDNPKPSSWRNIVIKVTETYGNNQSRPLRGAKVSLDLESSNNNAGLTTKFPQIKTTGPRGAVFSRMPPSSMVGKYSVTVDPKPNDHTNSYSCEKKTNSFNHSSRGTTKQFNFTCYKQHDSNQSVTDNHGNDDQQNQCHKVRIQQQEGRRQSTYATACIQANGRWAIEPYKY